MLNSELIEHMLDVFGYSQTIIFCEMMHYRAELQIENIGMMWIDDPNVYDSWYFDRKAKILKEEFLRKVDPVNIA